MKKSIFILFITLCITVAQYPLWAQSNSDKSGTTAAQFLKIGVGGRAMALGGSFVAQADDIYSLYWNASGITKVKGITFAAVYSNWLADISHQFFGLVIPISESSAIGAHAIVLSMDPVEVTTIDQPHGTGEFYDASDIAMGVSFATRLTNYFSLGITGKFIYQQIYNESASTFAVDISSSLDIPFYGLKLGMNFSNFGGKLQLDGRDLIREYDLNPGNTLNDGVETRLKTEPWGLPVNFAIGLSIQLIGDGESFLSSEKNHLTLSVTGNHPSDASEYASFGLEYILMDIVSLRGGYRMNRDLEKFFYGVGLKAPISGATFTFDYGLASYDALDYIHVFSIGLSFE